MGKIPFNIFAVIVCYNPDWEKLIQLTSKLIGSGVVPIVVDNGIFSKRFEGFPEVEYMALGDNFGIAEAQNIGISSALDKQADAVLFFDQDSEISADFITNLCSPMRYGNENVVAPIFRSKRYGFFYKVVKYSPGKGIKKIKPSVGEDFYTNIAISSGTLVKRSVFEKVGLMKAEFFIDYVDTEWCLRAYSVGIKVYVNTAAIMDHEIGDKTLNFGQFNVPVHSGYRRYYRIRNSFHLLRCSHVPKYLAIREITYSIIHQLILVAFCPNKRGYLKSLFYGIKDGLLNKTGKWIS